MSENRQKSVVMSVRFTPDEFATVSLIAARRGMTVSAYMREVAIQVRQWQTCGMCAAPITDDAYRIIRTLDETDHFTGRRVRLVVHAHEHHFTQTQIQRSA